MSRRHCIAGRWTAPEHSDRLPVVDPTTEDVLAEIPLGTAADADAAIGAARAAFDGWRRTAPAERGARLRRLARLVDDHADELAGLQSAENGKPLAMSRGDVGAAAGTLAQYAELGPLHRGRSLQGGWDAVDLMVAEPYGVAVVLVPWNDPLGIAAGLLGATLVTGNTVVFKPSEKTPLSAVRLVELALEAGLPAGVLNLLLGDGRTGAALVDHDDVDLVLHVGSVATGRGIAEACGRRLRKCVLELGGKDPLIVDGDVDPDWAAEQAAAGAFANAGQICTSVERIYVHEAVADPFLTALTKHAGEAELGPLVDERQRRIVHDHVTAAVDAGARLLTGGAIPPGRGFFYPATVLADVTDDMTVVGDETFGPVAPVAVVGSFDEALQRANGTRYGLAASVLTASQAHAQEAWRALNVGTVKVNAVWGGAPGGAAHPHKASGSGFGYGPELLDEVTQTKVVHVSPIPPPGTT
jgi:acyl-CoA reductase-like NAD-dependent aldehyde dehydrogenase